MHRDNVVAIMVVARDGTVLREYDHDKWTNSARVAIDPGTEYFIRVKNQRNPRRRVDVTIDGTMVMSGLIVPSFGSVDLERFQDSDKRFRAILASADGAGDPTDPSNGIIRVDVYEELQLPAYQPYIHQFFSQSQPFYDGGIQWPTAYPTSPMLGVMYTTTGDPGPMSFNASATPEPMKTVEGTQSNQRFIVAGWNGDVSSVPVTFSFRLTAKATAQFTSLYCGQCGLKRIEQAKFCHGCGVKHLT